MVQPAGGSGIELQHPRLRLNRHHLQAQQIAWITQEPPAHTAHPAGAAGDEAPQAGGAPGAGGQTQGPTLGLQRAIELEQSAARLCGEHTAERVKLPHLLHRRGVEHHAAFQRNGLAVIAGAGPPWGERHAMTSASTCHLHHLRGAGNTHHQIGAAGLQARHQRRRKTELVVGELLQQRPLINHIELGQLSSEVAKTHQSTLSARSTMNCPATARVSRE